MLIIKYDKIHSKFYDKTKNSVQVALYSSPGWYSIDSYFKIVLKCGFMIHLS